MTFESQTFKRRFATMGDTAEAVFAEAKPLGRTARYGWRRPKGVSMQKMPEVIRYTPDFYSDSGFLVEVMGLGKDGILKSMKVDKWEAMKAWNTLAKTGSAQLCFFIWNSSEEQYAVVSFEQMKRLVSVARRLGVEAFTNEDKYYYPIHWDQIIEVTDWVVTWLGEK